MAQYEEFTIDQGADVAIEVHLVALDGSTKDLTNHTVSAKLKKSYNSDSADTVDFTGIVATPATDGKITLSLSNTQTDALKAGRYVYDVELQYQDSDNNTIIERILEGRAQVTPSVTR
jgi:GTPase Era involved in 16S rRNA processing